MGGRHVGMSLLLLGWLVGAATGMAVAQGADGGPSPQPIDVSRVRFEKREDVELLLAVQREALELRRAGQREPVLAADRRGVALVRALRARLAREPEALVLEHDPWLAEREFKFLVDVQGDLVLLGRFEEGLATAREVRASQAFHADSAMGMESCRLEAEAQFGLLQYEKSLRTLEAGRVSCEGAVRRMLAEVRSLMGATRLDDSQALAVRDFYESAWDFRGVVRRIIQTLYSLGAWEEALAMYDLEVLQELDAVLEDEKALALLAQAYANVGGERFAESMVGRVRALNRMRRVESALSKAGFLREMAAEQPDPVALSKQALEVLAPLDALVGDDPICRAAVRALRGSILAEMGKPAEGLSEMQAGLVESARVVEPFLRHALEFRQQMGLTRVCLDLGRLADAHAALGLAEKAAGSTPADEDLLVLADLKGRILLKEERYTDAVVALREAVRLTEKERMGISIPAYRQTFFRRRYRIYERYIRALHGARRDGEALEAMEMMRARTLLDALGGVMVTRGVEPDLARRMKLESAQEREQAIAENRKMASSGPARLVTRGLESARLDSERTVTYAELIRTNPELAQLHAVSTVRTDQILRHVPADSVLLEFHVGEGFRAVMVAGAGRPPRLVELPCSYRELHEEVRALRKAMRSTGASRWRMSAERPVHLAAGPGGEGHPGGSAPDHRPPRRPQLPALVCAGAARSPGRDHAAGPLRHRHAAVLQRAGVLQPQGDEARGSPRALRTGQPGVRGGTGPAGHPGGGGWHRLPLQGGHGVQGAGVHGGQPQAGPRGVHHPPGHPRGAGHGDAPQLRHHHGRGSPEGGGHLQPGPLGGPGGLERVRDRPGARVRRG